MEILDELTEEQIREFWEWCVLMAAVLTLLFGLSILALVVWWLPLITIIISITLVGYLTLIAKTFLG